MNMGVLNVVSLVYLSFVVALIYGMNDHDKAGLVVKTTLRRWFKMIGALFVLGIIVQILSHI